MMQQVKPGRDKKIASQGANSLEIIEEKPNEEGE